MRVVLFLILSSAACGPRGTHATPSSEPSAVPAPVEITWPDAGGDAAAR